MPGYGVAWSIGGTAGEGLETAGEILARTLAAAGYRPTTQRDFPSRIRGGDTTSTVRVAPGGHLAPPAWVDVALAFNETVLPRMRARMDGGLLLVDEGISFEGALEAPLTRLAKESGAPRSKNVVALGISSVVLGLDRSLLEGAVRAQFDSKGEAVVEANVAALRAGSLWAEQHVVRRFQLPEPVEQPTLWLSGNEAAALGALAAGCRVVAAYPITPASDILEFLTQPLAAQGGIAVQMEDEIAALQVCVGAGFGGVKAMTATSGPGLSLMTETLGFAGSAEVPCVIVDCQRPGPSTGMPTKHAQEDLWHMIHGGHGEFVRVVLAPSDVADAFYATSEAFRLAHRFHCPAIVALDQQCSLFKQAVAPFAIEDEAAAHGKRPGSEAPAGSNAWEGSYLAYQEVGARALPGEPGGRYYANSTEHGPDGFTTEVPATRVAMVRRRLDLMHQIVQDARMPVVVEGDGSVVLLSWGSTVEACREARARLESQGIAARVVAVRLLWPFPRAAVEEAVGTGPIVCVEANATGQLARLVRSELPVHDRLHSVLRFDGEPIRSEEIVEAAQVVAP